MEVRFISDLHFNHEAMAEKRGFSNVNDMNEKIISKWNKSVNKRDLIYILGDVTFKDEKSFKYLNYLKGKKHLILGNHESKKHIKMLLNYIDSLSGPIRFRKKYWLSHIPIHPNELYGSINIHGHIHDDLITKMEWDYISKEEKVTIDNRYINVCCEQFKIDYSPKTLLELGIEKI